MSDLPRAPLSAFKPYKNNARTHSKRQIKQIAASIEEFGFVNPVLVDDDMTILAGHGRVLAAKFLRLEDAPYVKLSHLDEGQRRAYVLADNRLPKQHQHQSDGQPGAEATGICIGSRSPSARNIANAVLPRGAGITSLVEIIERNADTVCSMPFHESPLDPVAREVLVDLRRAGFGAFEISRLANTPRDCSPATRDGPGPIKHDTLTSFVRSIMFDLQDGGYGSFAVDQLVAAPKDCVPTPPSKASLENDMRWRTTKGVLLESGKYGTMEQLLKMRRVSRDDLPPTDE